MLSNKTSAGVELSNCAEARVRELTFSDAQQYMELIGTDYSEELFKDFFENTMSNLHKVFVSELNDELMASGTLVIERKLTHGGCLFGHIENVFVKEDRRGIGIGSKLAERLLVIAEEAGCYRADLTCDVSLEAFYRRAGLTKEGITMRKLFRSNFHPGGR